MPRNTLVATKRHALTPGDSSGIPETHKGGIKSKLKGPRPEAAIESKKAENGGCKRRVRRRMRLPGAMPRRGGLQVLDDWGVCGRPQHLPLRGALRLQPLHLPQGGSHRHRQALLQVRGRLHLCQVYCLSPEGWSEDFDVWVV
ncbi:uncharacterized protein LOC100853931 [Vitis vinifera]|uniref:Uncharacterized protein n=1 Tax=Vitis vinifera TaxID=29760 RepID=F6I0R7_VITVI|nr:uncharacterized protein LOC100853931 [Vitis vinifera]